MTTIFLDTDTRLENDGSYTGIVMIRGLKSLELAHNIATIFKAVIEEDILANGANPINAATH